MRILFFLSGIYLTIFLSSCYFSENNNLNNKKIGLNKKNNGIYNNTPIGDELDEARRKKEYFKKNIEVYKNIPTAGDVDEANRLIDDFEERYKSSPNKNGEQLIMYNSVRGNGLVFYFYEIVDTERQNKICKIFDGIKNSHTKKPLTIIFLRKRENDSQKEEVLKIVKID